MDPLKPSRTELNCAILPSRVAQERAELIGCLNSARLGPARPGPAFVEAKHEPIDGWIDSSIWPKKTEEGSEWKELGLAEQKLELGFLGRLETKNKISNEINNNY